MTSRLNNHFQENRPDIPQSQIRAALASIDQAVRVEIRDLLDNGRTKEAETKLLQYVSVEDRSGQIRAAESKKRFLFLSDNHRFGSVLVGLAIIVALLILLELLPWLYSGHL